MRWSGGSWKGDEVVRDIREGPPEHYWERLREMMGPRGLLTYWYLGRGFNQLEDPDTMRLRPDMRNAHFVAPGTVGPFLVLVDAVAGRDRRIACRLTLIDEGRDHGVVAVGAAAFRVD
jgi:hypothetical protein